MTRFAAALLIASLLSASASAQVKVDPHAEVAAVLFAASATQAALAKSTDAKLQAQQQRITQLAAELKAGDDRHRAEMVAAQDAFVADLAARDREYAAQIDVFRLAVNDIVASPDGARALERFNAGDEAAALSILDTLRAGNEKMRAARLRLEDAAEGRRIARLALEARLRGKVTLSTVITRYEEVVRLDPGVADDWLQLVRLYLEAGKLAEARRAVNSLTAAAHSDRERQQAASERADVLQAQGDLVGARRAAEECLRIGRALRAQAPDDADIQYLYSRSLLVFGEVARRQNDLTAAETAYQEEVALMRGRIAAPGGTDTDRIALSADLLHLADTLIARGNLHGARAAIEEDVALLRGVSAHAPENTRWQRYTIESELWLSDVLTALGQFDEARHTNSDIVANATRLSAAEPGNASLESDRANGYFKMAWLARVEGDYGMAREHYQTSRQIYEELGAPGAGGVAVRQNHALVTLGVGEMDLLLGDVPAARRHCQAAVEHLRALVALDATEASSRQYLAAALYQVAAALTADKDFKSARAAIGEGMAIDQAIVKSDAHNPDAQYDLSTAQLRSGEVLLAEGHPQDARPLLERSLTLRRQLADAQPGTSSLMRGVAEVMHLLVTVPGATVTRAALVTYLGTMQAQGLFWPADRPWLDE